MSQHALLLYVEPNPVLRRLGAAILRDVYTVVSVASIQDSDGGDEPAVIVLDLSNVATARGVWGAVTRRWPTVPVVVVTTAAAQPEMEVLRTFGPSAVVLKPFVPDALRQAVAGAVSLRYPDSHPTPSISPSKP